METEAQTREGPCSGTYGESVMKVLYGSEDEGCVALHRKSSVKAKILDRNVRTITFLGFQPGLLTALHSGLGNTHAILSHFPISALRLPPPEMPAFSLHGSQVPPPPRTLALCILPRALLAPPGCLPRCWIYQMHQSCPCSLQPSLPGPFSGLLISAPSFHPWS